MLRIGKRIFVGVFSVFIILLYIIHTPVAFAQALSPNINSDVPVNLHTYTQSLFLELTDTLLCQITGYDFIAQTQQCLGIDSKTHKIGYVSSNGLYADMVNVGTHAIAMVDKPPSIHTFTYVNYLSENFGVRKTEAAGSLSTSPGFSGLEPAFGAWQVLRNTSYTIITILFVVIGVAIMFRVKIDPRTVMSIENQIPKLIVALLLITFSYAIAGLLVDITYVIFYLIFNLLHTAAGVDLSKISVVQNSDFLSATNALIPANGAPACQSGVWCLISGAANVVQNMVYSITTVGTSNPISTLIEGITWVIFFVPKLLCTLGQNGANWPVVGFFLGGMGNLINGVPLIGALACNGAATILSLLAYLIAFVFILIAVFTTMFKIWWTLLTSYLFILINTILAPGFILAGLIPGSKIGAGNWIREMISNLIAFPAALFTLMLAGIFANTAGANQVITFPFIGGLGTGSGSGFGIMLALATFLITPKIIEDAKQLAGPGKNGFTSALGSAVGGAGGFAGGVGKQVGQTSLAARYDISGERRTSGATGRILQSLMR